MSKYNQALSVRSQKLRNELKLKCHRVVECVIAEGDQDASLISTDESVMKILYLALHQISKKWTMPIRDWKWAMSQFMILFSDACYDDKPPHTQRNLQSRSQLVFRLDQYGYRFIIVFYPSSKKGVVKS